MSALDKLLCRGQTIDEPAAGGCQIEGPGTGSTKGVLYKAGRRGENHFRCHRCDDDQIQLFRLNLGVVQGHFGCPGSQQGSGFLGRGDVPGFNPGARRDPFVGRIDALSKFVVGENGFGDINTGPGNNGTTGPWLSVNRVVHQGFLQVLPTELP